MKKRYFLLPILIISIIVFIVDNNRGLVNKEVIGENKEISYPYFNSLNIDKYIDNYLDDYINSQDEVFVDYDYIQNNGIYNVTFYKYLFDKKMVSERISSLIINVKSDTVFKSDFSVSDFDFVNNKKHDNEKKIIALTFDDGPNYNTSKIIDILNKYNVHATFFVLGSRIKGNENILNKMKDSGMEIGNHTYSHKLLTKSSEEKIKEEIDTTNKLIFDAIGSYPKLLRPSYGSINNKIKKASDMPIIIWDIDTLDWKNHNSRKISSRILNKVKDGDIILMHDIYSATANALDIVIPKLLDRGYELVTVSELFYYKKISLDEGKVYGFAR